MKKFALSAILLSILCLSLSGCIHWETPVSYKLLHDPSYIESVRIYSEDDWSEGAYDYSDPNDPCGELLCEIPSEQFTAIAEEITNLAFEKGHLIILFPVAIDPNFYYGNYIVKIEYQDGSCELISDIIQRQFPVNENYPKTSRYSTEQESWLAFLRNWVDIP